MFLLIIIFFFRDTTNDFPWIKKFEENFDVIRKELLALRSEKGFQPYRGPSWTSKIKAEDGSYILFLNIFN
jgi:aspartyl/asparaginyl beta-hydroxylase (cupin superfamily)